MSRFQIFRRILHCTYHLEKRFFSKKEQNKYFEKVSEIFERSFFYLQEWNKFNLYYVSECGKPESKIVQEIKNNVLPLSKTEFLRLFCQKRRKEKGEEEGDRKDAEADFFNLNRKNLFLKECQRLFYLVEFYLEFFYQLYVQHCLLFFLFQKV